MLVGHEEPWREWRAALQSHRMHHAWILAGPQGVGKGSFALAAAAELVAEPGVPQPRPEAHPDIIIPEHPPENKEEVKKREAGEAFTTKRSIPIDEIRAMQHRLNTRPSMGSRRVVIIDPADDMEKGAVNALLKSLEEPPVGTYFLLVTHRPGRLLPTVRSRCRVLRFSPLAADDIDRILINTEPQADAATRAAAIAAANGSPGVAMGFVEERLGGSPVDATDSGRGGCLARPARAPVRRSGGKAGASAVGCRAGTGPRGSGHRIARGGPCASGLHHRCPCRSYPPFGAGPYL